MARIGWTRTMDAAMRQFRRDGWTWGEVAAELGISIAAAKRRANWLDIPTASLSSGTLRGRQIAQGIKPQPISFRKPALRKRLGKRWL